MYLAYFLKNFKFLVTEKAGFAFHLCNKTKGGLFFHLINYIWDI